MGAVRVPKVSGKYLWTLTYFVSSIMGFLAVNATAMAHGLGLHSASAFTAADCLGLPAKSQAKPGPGRAPVGEAQASGPQWEKRCRIGGPGAGRPRPGRPGRTGDPPQPSPIRVEHLAQLLRCRPLTTTSWPFNGCSPRSTRSSP